MEVVPIKGTDGLRRGYLERIQISEKFLDVGGEYNLFLGGLDSKGML